MSDPHTSPSAPAESSSVVPWSVVRRIVALALKILVPLMLGTTLVGIVVFDGPLAVGAALVGMLITFLISIPMVLACFEDEVIKPDH